MSLSEGDCSTNFDCAKGASTRVCCVDDEKTKGCFTDSCIGHFCSTDGDCGGKNECCVLSKCTTYGCTECNSSSDCSPSEYCCKQRYVGEYNVCRRNCVGTSCHSSFDCAGPHEYCSHDKTCWKSGLLCRKDGDCKGNGECCLSHECVPCLECSLNSHCPASEYCCKRENSTSVCRESCVGEKCFGANDCAGRGEYCDLRSKKCERSTVIADWLIPAILVAIALFVNAIAFVFVCRDRFCSRRGLSATRRECGRRMVV